MGVSGCASPRQHCPGAEPQVDVRSRVRRDLDQVAPFGSAMVAVSGDDSQPAVAWLELARDGFALARVDGELHGPDEVLAERLLVPRFGEFVDRKRTRLNASH